MASTLSDLERVADIAINQMQACDTAVMDREDLRQEALLGALEAERRYDGRGGKGAWLLRRASGACVDAVRRMTYGPRKRSMSVVRLQDPVGESYTIGDLIACHRPSPIADG